MATKDQSDGMAAPGYIVKVGAGFKITMDLVQFLIIVYQIDDQGDFVYYTMASTGEKPYHKVAFMKDFIGLLNEFKAEEVKG